MTQSLRPMSLGELFDGAIQLFRSNLALFVGIGIFPGLASMGYMLASHHPHSRSDPTAASMILTSLSYLASFAFWLATVVVQPLSIGASCFATSKLWLDLPATITAAYRTVSSRTGRLVWLGFLQGLFSGWPLILVVIVFMVCVSASGSFKEMGTATWIVAILVSLPGIAGCVALYARYAMAYPASVIEDLPASSAIDRSVQLGQGFRWTACWAILLPYGLGAALQIGFTLLFDWLKSPPGLLSSWPMLATVLDGLSDVLVDMIFVPLPAILLTLLYYDLRVRKEGFDLERMLDALATAPPEPAIPSTTSPA